MDVVIQSEGADLAAHIARPRTRGAPRRPGLVLCHGFPAAPSGAGQAGSTYTELADWLASEASWVVMAFNFRGAGASKGNFSLGGWLADLRAAVAHLRSQPDVSGVWVAGFREGGALAVCATGDDRAIKGVAALAAPVDFERWAVDPRRSVEEARRNGAIVDPAFPADFEAWAREFREIRPLTKVVAVPPRPLLVVHGTDDITVPLVDARALADAAAGDENAGEVDFRVLSGAGHHLRHDPRAVAILLGWLERQQI
ncbi:MAG TPA: prolyl oligopeptidase family serine peptidase [Acidimicrobiales bacterium]|nr:prolyl oligopeptidase family serine peptidase [Acidimicrobiales bacterium]